MDNYLDTGGVLPSGLLSGNDLSERMAGFNKTYKNYPLRAGIVNKIYAYNDPQNFTKLSTEYDVLVFEQNEDRGSTIITYKNCLASDGLGSIPDFFEKNYRVKTVNDNPTGDLNSVDQNGAIVILLCLDAVTEKAIIIGGLNHPNRQTTLTDTQPQLQGEYNGVNVAVNIDGSTSLTFKGATDNDGEPIDDSQGNTVVEIAQDGSFSVSHSTITFSLDRSGVVTLTAKGDVNINTEGQTNITTQGDTNFTTQGDTNITSTGKVVVTGSEIDLDGNVAHVITDISSPVIDTIFGEPQIGFSKVKTGAD